MKELKQWLLVGERTLKYLSDRGLNIKAGYGNTILSGGRDALKLTLFVIERNVITRKLLIDYEKLKGGDKRESAVILKERKHAYNWKKVRDHNHRHIGFLKMMKLDGKIFGSVIVEQEGCDFETSFVWNRTKHGNLPYVNPIIPGLDLVKTQTLVKEFAEYFIEALYNERKVKEEAKKVEEAPQEEQKPLEKTNDVFK